MIPFSSPNPVTFLGMSLQLSPSPSPGLHTLFGFEGFASIQAAGREEVASSCPSSHYLNTAPQAAFLVLRDLVQMKATEKEEWAMEKPWRGSKVDGEVC